MRKLLFTTLLAVFTLISPSAFANDPGFSRYRVIGNPLSVVTGVDGAVWTLSSRKELSRISTSGKVSNRTVRVGRGYVGEPGYEPPPWIDIPVLASSGDGFLTYIAQRYLVQSSVLGKDRVRLLKNVTDRFSYNDISDIIQGPTGSVWLSSGANINVLTESGRVKSFRVPVRRLGYPANASALKLAVGADGNVWFTYGSGVGRVTPEGRFLPYIEVFKDLASKFCKYIVRGGDEHIWVVADSGPIGDPDIARISLNGAVEKGTFFRYDPNVGNDYSNPDTSSFESFAYTALAAGPAASVWITHNNFWSAGRGGFDGTYGDGTIYYLDGNTDAGGTDLTGSAQAYGLTAAPQNRMFVTQFDTGEVVEYKLPRQLTVYDANKVPRPLYAPKLVATTRLLSSQRTRSTVLVKVKCIGSTGGFCTGKLKLRISGRSIGRATPYAIPAAPAIVNSRSVVRLKLSKGALRRAHSEKRLSVQDPNGKTVVVK